MTRARERLILSGAARFEAWSRPRADGAARSPGSRPAFVPELAARGRRGGGEVRPTGRAVRRARRAAGGSAAGAAPPGRAPPRRRPRRPSPLLPAPPGRRRPPPAAARAPPVATLSYSSLGAYARCGYRFYAERVLGLPPAGARGRRRRRRAARPGLRSAADRGVLVHALLERLDFRRPVVPAGGGDRRRAAAAPARRRPAPRRRRADRAGARGSPPPSCAPGSAAATEVAPRGALRVPARRRRAGHRRVRRAGARAGRARADRRLQERPARRGRARRTWSRAPTPPSGWSTRWRRCAPAPPRSRSPTASSSAPRRR